MSESRDLFKFLEESRGRKRLPYIEGKIFETKDSQYQTIILTDRKYLKVPKDSILGYTPSDGKGSGLYVQSGAPVWVCELQSADALDQDAAKRVDEENIYPPSTVWRQGDPVNWSSNSKALLTAGKSLEGACKEFTGKCKGGGSHPNDCAHFLSDGFILAGFSELNTNLDCVEIRCSHDDVCSNLGAKLMYRIIRAKNLRCWFAEKASKTATSIEKNTGFWATYQERASDGQGHVAIIDTNSWTYYGTGWYPTWEKQEFYQW